jgi:RNA polymerase sigma-70 factor (sigma-E family)
VRQDGKGADLELFLVLRGDALLQTAVLLAGSKHGGEDLLQEALERLVRHWHRLDGDPEGYARRTLRNLAIDGWRRRTRRPEVLGLPLTAMVPDPADQVDLTVTMLSALAQLTPRQRAVLVVRYWEQLSEAETAESLGCTVSAVKAAAGRGLRRLRELMDSVATPGQMKAKELPE